MHLTDDEVREFATLWDNEFGETLEFGAARHRAFQLIQLMAMLAEPVPSEAVDGSDPDSQFT